MSSYDVKAPFHFGASRLWPKHHTQQVTTGTTLHSRTPFSTHNIMYLVEFCLKSTFFTFQGQYYKQVQGAAMGFPLSPVVVNIFMEEFKSRALSSSLNPPRIWLGFVDNTFIVHKAEHTQQFLSHFNSLVPNIQFTTESSDQHGSLPFVDASVSQASNGTLITSVHRKATHTDEYLHWDSHHNITNKYTLTQGLVCLLQPAVIGTRKPTLPYGTQQVQLP